MLVGDFERYATDVGLPIDQLVVNGQPYLRTRVQIGAGTHAGTECEVAILRTNETPWVPQAALQVRPHLVRMGEKCSHASPLGSDWQYLSRRFDRTPTPKMFLAHILTALGEL